MYSLVKDWRSKRNVFNSHYSVENYYTDVQMKREMKHSFGDDLLNNLHLLPDPLKKNLADSLITSEEPKQKKNKNLLNTDLEEDYFPTVEEHNSPPKTPQMAPFSGITSFFSGVMSVITGAMSQLRPKSPAKYYDCYDGSNVGRQGSPPPWHRSNGGDQNKNERARNIISSEQADLNTDMSDDCRSAAAQCEDKLNKVRLLLSTKPVATPKYRSRHHRKAFVEPGSVSESFEDAFSPEDFVSLSNESYIEYCSPSQYHCEELSQTDSPRMRTHIAPESTEIVKTLPVVCTDVKSDSLNNGSVIDCKIVNNCNVVEEKLESNVKFEENIESNIKGDELSDEKLKPENTKGKVMKDDKISIVEVLHEKTSENINPLKYVETNKLPNAEIANEEIILSCEDKVSKLKALLKERRKNNKTITSSDSVPESIETNDKPPRPPPIEKTQDKHFKNPCRRTDKRRKCRMRKNISDDLLFANEIHSDYSSDDNSPSTKSSEERFAQTVPNGLKTETNPASSIKQIPNEVDYFDEISGRFHSTSVDSEDSFQIVFNDSPSSRGRFPSDCDSEDSFIVFEDGTDSCYTSNDVFGDQSADDSDYTDSDSDASDSGVPKLAPNLSRTIGDLTDDSLYVDEVDCAVRVCEEIPDEDVLVGEKTGVLLTEAKKLLRKDQPRKKVKFSERPPEVHVMRVWAFAARQARRGHWERYALDRDRFKRRIADVDMAVSWVLKPQHRSRVMFQRFMPWWNQLRRKELAEKKIRQEEERKLAEEKAKEELRLAAEREKEELRLAEENEKEEERLRIEAEKKAKKSKSNKVICTKTHDSEHSKLMCNDKHDNTDPYVKYKANARKTRKLEKLNAKIGKYNNIDKKCIKNEKIKEHNDVIVSNGDKIGDDDGNIDRNRELDSEIDDKTVADVKQNGVIQPIGEEYKKSLRNNDSLKFNEVLMTDDTVSGT